MRPPCDFFRHEILRRSGAALPKAGKDDLVVAPDPKKVMIDNVAITDNAAAKGFDAGLTFVLVGSMVTTDGYVCAMICTRDGKATGTTVKHVLHSTIGNKADPEGLTPMTPADAVNVVMDQQIWNGRSSCPPRALSSKPACARPSVC